MGYVNPDPSPDTKDFDDQFEWDGHAWLFRRFHRARPVHVSAEEMDWSINHFARLTKWFGIAGVTAWFLFLILWDWLGPDEGAQRSVQEASGVLLFAMVAVGRRWIWQRTTERFARRVPVGPGQSWIEYRQEQAATSEWSALVLPAALVAAGAYFLWPFDQISWLDAGTATILAAAAIFDVGLKLRSKLL